MDSNLEKALTELGKEMAGREKTIREEWYRTHEKNGRDGGPIQVLKELHQEEAKRYREILEKYQNN